METVAGETIADGLDSLPIKELRRLAHTELSTGSRLMRKAEIISALRAYRTSAAKDPWAAFQTPGVLRINGVRFMASAIEPTAEGSEYAWVTGMWVTASGKPSKQIFHQHCPPGERMELVHISTVQVR